MPEGDVDYRAKVKPLAALAAACVTVAFALVGLVVYALAYVAPPFDRPPAPDGGAFAVAGLALLVLVFFAAKGAVMVWMRPVWQLARELSPRVRPTEVRVRGRLFPFRVAIEMRGERGVVAVEGRSGAQSALSIVAIRGDRAHEVGAVKRLPVGAADAAARALELPDAGAHS